MIQRLPLHWTRIDVPRCDRVPDPDDVDELTSEPLLHGALRDGERTRAREAFEPHADELAWQQAAIGIRELARGTPACRWPSRATAP